MTETSFEFSSLYRLHYQKCFDHAILLLRTRQQAEDLVQDVFEKIWRNRRKEPVLDWPAYLFVLIRNKALSSLRKSKREQAALKDISKISPCSSHLLTEELYYENEYRRILQKAISKLPAQRKKVFVLGKMEGWKRDRIAAYLGLSPNTVKATMQQAIRDIEGYIFAKEKKVFIKDKLLKAA